MLPILLLLYTGYQNYKIYKKYKHKKCTEEDKAYSLLNNTT